jgi:hypothetical protein
MAGDKVNHNVWKPFDGTAGALTVSGGATPTKTSEWYDTNGWTDKVVSFEVDSGGTIDTDVIMHVSPQHYYELNNKTCTTDDYVAVTIVEANTSGIMVIKDATDVDDLQRPHRSTRFVIDNDQAAEAVTGFTVYLEGWS